MSDKISSNLNLIIVFLLLLYDFIRFLCYCKIKKEQVIWSIKEIKIYISTKINLKIEKKIGMMTISQFSNIMFSDYTVHVANTLSYFYKLTNMYMYIAFVMLQNLCEDKSIMSM